MSLITCFVATVYIVYISEGIGKVEPVAVSLMTCFVARLCVLFRSVKALARLSVWLCLWWQVLLPLCVCFLDL